MIYRLQRKFILISTVSVLAVLLLVFLLMTAFNYTSMNRTLDVLADRISEGDGRFPVPHKQEPPRKEAPRGDGGSDFITSETPFSTRYFTVWLDREGAVARVNTESIHSVSETDAVTYAQRAMQSGSERGWISHFRYKVFETKGGEAVVLIDGSTHRTSLLQTVTVSAFVLLGCGALVILLILLLSKRMVKPVAESYEKQKQFITDANHELKTPLTLILANLDIAREELGENEWLEDIRAEGLRMTDLVNQLVTLSRMDEESGIETERLSLDEITGDTAAEFASLAESRGKTMRLSIDEDVRCLADEALLRRLLSILLDNAVKYCDEGGEILLTLKRRRRPVLTVENSYADVNVLQLDRLFDRFYRADRARAFTGGYGIGLSIAKSIAEKHRWEISAYKKSERHVGFKVVF